MRRCFFHLAAALFLVIPGSPSNLRADHFSRIDWQILTDPPVEVRYSLPSEDTAREVLFKSRQYLDQVSELLGVEISGAYVIVLARSREEFKDLQFGASPVPEWAGALTYPDLGVVLLMTPRALSVSGSGYWALVQHEIVHLVMGEAEARNGVRMPRWFSEGAAVYFSGEMTLGRLLHLSWAQMTGRTLSFEKLERRFPEDTAMAEAAYAQSYLLMKYLSRRYGDDALARLVRAFLEEGRMEDAFLSAFGSDMAQIMDGFSQYSRVKATWIPVLTSSATIWAAITVLFLWTYVRKKIRGYRTMEVWKLEEEWEQASQGYPKDDEEPRTLH